MTARLAWSVWIILFGGLLYWLSQLFPQANWSSSLTAAFPQESGQWQQELLSDNTANQQFRIVLTGLPDSVLKQAAKDLIVSTAGEAASWRWLAPSDALKEMTEFAQYSAGRIASPAAQQQLAQQQFQPLIEAAWQRLLSPLPLPDEIVLRDPLLLAQQQLEEMLQRTGQGNGLQPTEHGYMGHYDNKGFILIQAQLQFDPFDSTRTQQILAQLSPIFQELEQQYSGLQVLRSGVVFHAAIASNRAQYEMTWYGGFSLLAIAFLVIVVFRSLYPLLISSLLLGTAVLAGLVAVLLCFDSPHLIAFVFATTLIGVAIDYAFHGMLAVQHGKVFFRNMLPGLQLSLVSTLIGYVVLFLLPLPILNQVAVFMMAGLLVVYLLVHWLLPAVLPNYRTSDMASTLADKYLNVWHQLSIRRSRTILLCAPIIALAIVIALLRTDDNVRLLNSLDPNLVAQEKQIQLMTGMHWDMQFVLVQAETLDELLSREQQVVNLLAIWQQQDKLTHWQALTDWLLPLAQQQQLQERLQAAYQAPAMQAYLQELGIATPPKQQQLTLSQLPAALQMLVVTPDHSEAPALVGVIPIQGWRPDNAHLEQLRSIGLVDIYNPVEHASDRLRDVRLHLQNGLTIAALSIFAFLCWYFGWKRAVAIAMYLCVCGCFALLGPLLAGHAINLFHLVGLVLVLALTMDYAIFFSSQLAASEVQLAVGMSAITSMLAFGVLILSQTPVISGFGLTILPGIAIALFFAPILRTIKLEDSVP